MKFEKSFIISLVLLIVIATSVTASFLYFKYIYKEERIVEIGDCIEIEYVGRYASNNTVFDTNNVTIAKEEGLYDENRTYEPLKVYINPDDKKIPPEGYEDYRTIIEGLKEGLIGMKEGESKTIGPIPPEKAYGKPVTVNTTFNTSLFTFGRFQQEFKVLKIAKDYLVLRWEVKLGMNFTIFPFWENGTTVSKVNDTMVWLTTTPTQTENLTIFEEWPNLTTVVYNETNITFIQNPKVGTNTTNPFNPADQNFYKIINLTDKKIIVSYKDQNGTTHTTEWNRTISMARVVNQTRIYNLSSMFFPYLENDISSYGFSFNKLAGETLYYDVKILKVHKLS